MRAFGLAALLVLVGLPASAAVAPGLINYQGRLLDQGIAADGNFTMTFRIFDDAVAAAGGPCGDPGSRCVWEETQGGVTVTGGIFNVLLGSSNPLSTSVFSGPDRWIEIEVAGDLMSPRQRIASAAYALNVESRVNPSVVVAASDSTRLLAADFIADGSDDQLTIQAAIDSLPATGGEVLLLQGTYYVTGTTVIPGEVRLIGQGPGSNIVADPGWDPPDEPAIPMLESVGPGLSGGPGAPRTRVAHLKLTSNGDFAIYGWHGVNGSFNGRIHHNHFVGFRSLFGAIDASGSNRNIISDNVFDDCAVGYNGTDTNVQFGNIVANNIFTECTEECIWGAWPWEMTVVGNYINTSQPNASGIRINGSYGDIGAGEVERGRIVIANNVIKVSGATPDSNGMVLGIATPSVRALFGDLEKALITGNYVSVDNADAVVFVSHAERVLLTGNTFDGESNIGSTSASAAIRVGGAYDASRGAPSEGIDIIGNNFYGGASGAALELDNLGHQGIVFKDNHVYGYGRGVEIQAGGGGTAASGTRITDNIFTDVATPITDNGVQTVIRNNSGFATENSGEATIADGTTSIVVAHGLGITPEIRNVSVTPTGDLSDARTFWVDSVTSTGFTIHVDKDPGGSVTFVWQIGSNG